MQHPVLTCSCGLQEAWSSAWSLQLLLASSVYDQILCRIISCMSSVCQIFPYIIFTVQLFKIIDLWILKARHHTCTMYCNKWKVHKLVMHASWSALLVWFIEKWDVCSSCSRICNCNCQMFRVLFRSFFPIHSRSQHEYTPLYLVLLAAIKCCQMPEE